MRKLATGAISYAAAVFIAGYLLPDAVSLVAAAAVVILTVFTFFIRNTSARTRAVLIMLPAAAGLLWSWGYNTLFIKPCVDISGTFATVRMRVTDYIDYSGGYQTVYVRIVGDTAPNTSALLVSFDNELPELSPGDEITAEALLTASDGLEKEDMAWFTARGINIKAYLQSEPKITGRWGLSFIYFPRTIAKVVGEAIRNYFPADVSHLFSALLLGDKADLKADAELILSMNTAGVTHIVSVSGMHVSFLVGFIRMFTRRRRTTAAVAIPMVWVFAVMCGAGPAVVRAAFMQTALLTAPLLRREEDSLTSLSAVLALLLIINPIACKSVSLQLSFTAMAGIIIITPRIYDWMQRNDERKKYGKLKKWALKFVRSSASTSIGAMAFSLPVSVIYFGFVPIYFILSNLLLLWLVSFIFIGGYAASVLGLAIPAAGVTAAWLIAWPARLFIAAVKLIASLPFAAVYTTNNFVAWWVVITYVIFLSSWLLKGKNAYRPVVPVCMSVCTLCFIIFVTQLSSAAASITVLDVGQGQSISITYGNECVVIDCGGDGTAGETTAEYLLGNAVQDVDLLILTHLHADHAGGVQALMAMIDVKRMALPADADDSDSLYSQLIENADRKGTEIYLIDGLSDMSVGGVALSIYASGGAQENERGLIIYASVNDFDLLVTGDTGTEIERIYSAIIGENPTEALVIGHHGSRYSTSQSLLDAITPDVAIISVGADNKYGHPAQEVLDRLDDNGIKVYRTDLSGNITISVAG